MLPLIRRSKRVVALAVVFLVVGLAGAASAGTILPGVYRLLDHPDGDISPPPYGLRVDSFDPDRTFSVETGGANVLLDWDGGATATISGTLWNNQDGELWTVSYQLTGVTAVGTLGFTATAGNGTLTDTLANDYVLVGEQNGSGYAFEFLADGHRLTGDGDTPVGRGWIEPPASTDDWLVRAELIPEPTTGCLLGLGLCAIGLARRRSATGRR